MGEQWPSKGRVVHFDPGNTECHAATVAGIGADGTTWEDGVVNLGNITEATGEPLTTRDGNGWALNVPLRVGPAGRTGRPSWHWPEYVGPHA